MYIILYVLEIVVVITWIFSLFWICARFVGVGVLCFNFVGGGVLCLVLFFDFSSRRNSCEA